MIGKFEALRRLLVDTLEGIATLTGARGTFGRTRWRVRITKHGYSYHVVSPDGRAMGGYVSADRKGLDELRNLIADTERHSSA